jgi:transketolase C-terminal domain/subunit
MLSMEPIRAGFGKGLKAAGEANDKIVALCADLTDSTQVGLFRETFPDRFIETGISEQNLVTVASGLAASQVKFHLLLLMRLLVPDETGNKLKRQLH